MNITVKLSDTDIETLKVVLGYDGDKFDFDDPNSVGQAVQYLIKYIIPEMI